MFRAIFVSVLFFVFVDVFSQSDTIFVEELDTIYLESKTIIIDSILFIDRKQISHKNSLILYSGIYSPQFNSDLSYLRSSYTDSLNSAYSNLVGFKNGLKIQHNINKINLQFGVNYSYTRFKFSHIDLDSLEYSCHNSIRSIQFSGLLGYKIAQLGKISITPLLGFKFATIQKVTGLIYNPELDNFRSYLSEIGSFNKKYYLTNLNLQITYNSKKMILGLAPEINLPLSELTKKESVIHLSLREYGLLAFIGYKF